MINIINKIKELTEKRDIEWRKACEFEGIPDYELFVVFGNDNPHAIEVNNIALQLLELREQIFAQAYPTAYERMKV